jgi:hypothetical protein
MPKKQLNANDGKMKRKEYEKELQSCRWSCAICRTG